MRRYETLIVMHPELPEAQTRETIDRLRRLIEAMGGECHQMHEWGTRELTYPIRKQSRGYYVLAEYTAKPDVVQELGRTLRIGDEFLRFLTVAAATQRRREPRPKAKRTQPENVTETEAAPSPVAD